MRRILLLFLILFVAIGGVDAQTQRKTKKTPWPLKARNVYVKNMLKLDSINLELMGDPTVVRESDELAVSFNEDESISTEEKIKSLLEARINANEVWHRFVWLCNKGKFAEALSYYDQNLLDVNIALSHSQVRLAFHDEVLGHMAYEYLPVNEAIDIMIRSLEFDLSMLSINFVTSGQDHFLSSYDYVYELLQKLYFDADRKEAALDLVDRWGELYSHIVEDPYVLKVFIHMEKSIVHSKMGDDALAAQYLMDAKAIVEKQMAESEDKSVYENMLGYIHEGLSELGVDAK